MDLGSNLTRRQSIDLVNRLNSGYMGDPTQVVRDVNPFASNILAHSRVSDTLRRHEEDMRRMANTISSEDIEPYWIESPSELRIMPESMRIPVLADLRIREYHKEHMISGWGIDPDLVAEHMEAWQDGSFHKDKRLSFNTSKVDGAEFKKMIDHAADLLFEEIKRRNRTQLKDPTDILAIHPIYDRIV